jgi:hypothetical protein
MLCKWQKEIIEAMESGQLTMLSATEMEIRRRAAQRSAVSHWLDAWRMAHRPQPKKTDGGGNG